MSTYECLGNNPDHEVIYGWDPAVNSYFFHVIDKTKEEDEEGYDVLWVGTTPNEILDLEELRVIAEEYIDFTSEMWIDLYSDANR